jgi:hypothetical protein
MYIVRRNGFVICLPYSDTLLLLLLLLLIISILAPFRDVACFYIDSRFVSTTRLAPPCQSSHDYRTPFYNINVQVPYKKRRRGTIVRLGSAKRFFPLSRKVNGHQIIQEEEKTNDDMVSTLQVLVKENEVLKTSLRQAQIENARLYQALNGRPLIVLETFEGEGRQCPEPQFDDDNDDSDNNTSTIRLKENLLDKQLMIQVESFVDTDTDDDNSDVAEDDNDVDWITPMIISTTDFDKDTCPVEPTISFGEALRDRSCWLVGLLVLQSLSGLILAQNQNLLSDHPVSM